MKHKLFNLSIYFLSFLVIISCSENITKEKKLILTKVAEITNSHNSDNNSYFNEISTIEIDNEQNIYIVDNKAFSIKKYNKNGNFIKSFGKHGNGPGEFSDFFSLCLSKDTIYVLEPPKSRVHYFDIECNYIKTHKTDTRTPQKLKAITNNIFVGTVINFIKDKSNFLVCGKLNLYDKSFKIYSTLYEKKISIDLQSPSMTPRDVFPYFSVKHNNTFFALIDDKKVSVMKYDITGKLSKTYHKGHILSKMTDKEVEILRKSFNIIIENKKKDTNILKLNKKAVLGLWLDKFNNIVIHESTNNQNENHFICFTDSTEYFKLTLPGIIYNNKENIGDNLYFFDDFIYMKIENNDSVELQKYSYSYE